MNFHMPWHEVVGITVGQRMEVVNRFLRDVGYSSQAPVGGYQALVDLVKSDLRDEVDPDEPVYVP